jgi:hypothetical protein
MRKTIAFLMAALLGLALLGACGAKSEAPQEYAPMAESAAYEEDWEPWIVADGEAGAGYAEDEKAGETLTGAPVQDSLAGRKVIKDVEASVETRQFDRYAAAVEAKAKALGGYVESRNVWGRDRREATLVLRVPAGVLERFKGSLEELGKVMSMNESVRDITSNYTDVAAHIQALRTERDALLKLMNQAGNLEDLLKVQDRLTDVRYRLDNLESQMRQMEDQIALSTVTLRIYEVERVTPEQPKGFWAKTWANFKENLFSVGRGLRDFASGFLSAIPYLVLIAVPVAVAVVLIVRRRRKKKSR